MSEIMRPIPFADLVKWTQGEYGKTESIFGIRKDKFYRNKSARKIRLFGTEISSPVGPAAGPHAQLAQNIAAAYLAGARFIELKTVQTMDGEELRKCVARPCINATDECYNVEWSTELTVPEAYEEYVKAWFLLHFLAKEYQLGQGGDFIFNMSVGYNLEGIQSPKIDSYIEGMKNARDSEVWKTCYTYLAGHLGDFKHFSEADLNAVSSVVSTSITLSTLHGCPKEEIERIADYLLTHKGLHTYIKCNPTLLGYERARKILDEMGFRSVSFDDHHFKDDLQYKDALEMLKRLQTKAREKNLAFGVKITNTFPVEIKRSELPGSEMYMSGRALFPLSINVAKSLSLDFNGTLPISYSGGADFFNIKEIIQTGIRPITVATTILKPGGYERLQQLAMIAEDSVDPALSGINVDKLSALTGKLPDLKRYRKEYRQSGLRKTKSPLPLFDCFKAPCQNGGCPIHQQIPAYLEKINSGDYAGAFKIIAVDNAAPSITGAICNHECQDKCTRVDYDDPLSIRAAKKIAADNAEEAFTGALQAPALKTDKKAAVIGAGPAGIAAALFLRRNGVPVTVYEKEQDAFGIVRFVIPEFRIKKEEIERDYRLALKYGVEFQFGVDERYSLDELKKTHAFVLLATGAWKAGEKAVKEGDGNILDALSFLAASKASCCSLDLGASVAVVGGGDVAMDCARAAKRNKGVQRVAIVYRRTVSEMPAQFEEQELARADGIEFIELYAPESFSGGELVCRRMKLGDYDAKGRRSVSPAEEKRSMQFDTLIQATGARVDTSLFEKNKIRLNDRGLPLVNEANESSIPDVYIIGDSKAGPATVVKGLADGKSAALDILKKLGLPHDFITFSPEHKESAALYAKKGILSPAIEGNTDACRCLSCAEICEICVDVCPNRANVAIEISGPFATRRQIVHIDRMCNECGNCAVFCPHSGAPYKDKFTVFSSEEDFTNSENPGFLVCRPGNYQLRLADKTVLNYKAGDKNVPADIAAFIEHITKAYGYLVTEA
ncbi:MAG: putative selenate reductase subunit YgfK [Spirochaetaceae bacterium]|jgi:putative selenate reductase|nr:putative selenate reductase subunit YgfK [Spirochaetaceae bacterium]